MGYCLECVAPVMFLSFILLFLITQTVPSVDSAFVELELRDGRRIKGLIDGANFSFSGLTMAGEPVWVQVSEPPDWSNVKWVCRIDWDALRQLFVVRNFSWTGELKQIWNQMTLTDESGEAVIVLGNDIQTARFGYSESR